MLQLLQACIYMCVSCTAKAGIANVDAITRAYVYIIAMWYGSECGHIYGEIAMVRPMDALICRT